MRPRSVERGKRLRAVANRDRPVHASMRPRSVERGKERVSRQRPGRRRCFNEAALSRAAESEKPVLRPGIARFNEAALCRARKVHDRAAVRKGQKGFNEAALSRARKDGKRKFARNAICTASMRPRSVERGKLSQRRSPANGLLASMRRLSRARKFRLLAGGRRRSRLQ